MARKTSPEDKRRYNLHYIIRKQGYRLTTHEKTIYVHHKHKDFSPQVMELKNRFNYAVQYEI